MLRYGSTSGFRTFGWPPSPLAQFWHLARIEGGVWPLHPGYSCGQSDMEVLWWKRSWINCRICSILQRRPTTNAFVLIWWGVYLVTGAKHSSIVLSYTDNPAVDLTVVGAAPPEYFHATPGCRGTSQRPKLGENAWGPPECGKTRPNKLTSD